MDSLDNKKIFSNNLKKYMSLQGKTRNEISEALNIPYTTLAGWEKGINYPRISNLEKLAKFLKISISDLVENKCVEPLTYDRATSDHKYKNHLQNDAYIDLLLNEAQDINKEDLILVITIIQHLKNKNEKLK